MGFYKKVFATQSGAGAWIIATIIQWMSKAFVRTNYSFHSTKNPASGLIIIPGGFTRMDKSTKESRFQRAENLFHPKRTKHWPFNLV